jgi:hypothetical protein
MSDEVVVKTTPIQTRTKLWMDLLIFLAFLVAMDPRSSGVAVHEWLALSMLAALTIHLLLSWDWIINISQRFLGRLGLQNRINYILNWLLFIDGTLLIVSGVMISRVAMPYLGIHLPEGFAWRGLHSLSANFALIILGLHTALHWGWVVNTFSRYLIQPVVRLFSSKPKKDAAL